MNIVGVIPSRYSSTRLPGKPLKDICGHPMIWWVYNQVIKSRKLNSVVCAIDDDRIKDACEKNKIPYMMTSPNHPNHISRIHEVSENVEADYYVCVNGDEPMISAECIDKTIPDDIVPEPAYFGACRRLSNAAETIDFANIKLVMNESGRCIYLSRAPIPYPKGTLDFNYWKYVGIECFNKAALDFFVNTPMGNIERVEDIDHLRFIENGIPMYFKEVQSESISVDTAKDLDFVRTRFGQQKN